MVLSLISAREEILQLKGMEESPELYTLMPSCGLSTIISPEEKNNPISEEQP
jgi:hypothetical protein